MSYIFAGLFFIETWLFSFYVQEIPRKSPNVCHSSNLPSILQISYLVYSFQVNYHSECLQVQFQGVWSQSSLRWE